LAAEPKATPERVVFICFNTNTVKVLREKFPAYRAYWLTGTGPKKDGTPGPTAEQIIATAKACDASGVDVQDSVDITQAFIDTVKAAGLRFHVWTVNKMPRARELAAMGVETITTDCGAAFKQTLYGNPADARPVIHWTFDGNGKNGGAGGARCDAAIQGKAEYVEGKRGQGLRLDGAGNGVAGGAYSLPLQGTVALWFKPEAFYNFNTVFDNDVNPDNWEMWVADDGLLKFRIVGGVAECDLNALGGPGKWYHLAVVWDTIDTAQTKLYVDGVERASAAARWVASGGTFYVGGGNPGNKKGKGVVDDVRVYGVPLSDAQVQALFKGAK
jgi:hypothetical protein